jgi:hypothetical protein
MVENINSKSKSGLEVANLKFFSGAKIADMKCPNKEYAKVKK